MLATAPFSEPIVVTGATGFIGRRLVARLIAEGASLRALVLPNQETPRDWGDAVEVCRGDITSRSDVARALRNAGTLVHLAAVVGDWGQEERFHDVTVVGTENALGAAARRSIRTVLVSSVVVYGERIGAGVCDEDQPFGRPLGPYSRSKQEQERIARRLEADESLPVTIVRPANVFGPGSGPWVDTACRELRRGVPTLVNGGDQIAGLTYVDNVVDVIARALARPGSVGRVYNANDDHGVTWRRYFTDLARLCGAPAPRSIPRFVAEAAARLLEPSYRILRRSERPAITREALNLIGSSHRIPIDRARRELGYEPLVSYDEALDAIAAYLREAAIPNAS